MVYAYIRVSTDKQSTKNQYFEIKKHLKRRGTSVDKWIEETVSGRKNFSDRQLGRLLDEVRSGDIVVVSELSRLGRNLMQIMGILHMCMEKEIKIITIKERYELGDNINSKVLAFAFALSAEIEHNLISLRTKEALARKRAEGKRLGRPLGFKPANIKLTGKEEQIRQMLLANTPKTEIMRTFNISRNTLNSFIKSRKIV